MLFENWITYVIAYAVISIIPGPSVFMVIGQSLSRGTRAAFACVMGDLAGGVIVMTASGLIQHCVHGAEMDGCGLHGLAGYYAGQGGAQPAGNQGN